MSQGGTGAGPASHDEARVSWVLRRPHGHARALGTLASGPMAVLAGFTLAAAVALAVDDQLSVVDHLALLVFGSAAALLIVGLHLASEAEGLYSTPAENEEWEPEILRDATARTATRRNHRFEFAAFLAFRHRSLNAYHGGSSLALVGLALLVFGRIDLTDRDLRLDGEAVVDLLSAVVALGLLAAGVAVASYAPQVHRAAVPGRLLTAGRRRRWQEVSTRTTDPRVADTRFADAVIDGARHVYPGAPSAAEAFAVLAQVEDDGEVGRRRGSPPGAPA